MTCYLAPNPPQVFLQLGRFGDLLILFPGFKAIFDATGIKPVVMVSQEFAGLFDGISYAEPWPVNFDWRFGLGAAIQFVRQHTGDFIVPKWWDDPNFRPPPVNPAWKETVSVSFRGQTFVMPADQWGNYMATQWENAGFKREQLTGWPLVFDRRDATREAALARSVFRTNRPKLLYNFSGATNPFPFPHLLAPMLGSFTERVELVDLGKVRAHRIYDLLGLYDRACGLLTSDTATLHLAGASSIRYAALVCDGWSGSVPRGNCVLKVPYGATQQNLHGLHAAIKGMVPPASKPVAGIVQTNHVSHLALTAAA